MMLSHTQFPRIPIDRPHPDVRRLIRVLLGQERTPRPPMVEFLIDPFVRQSIVTGLLGREWVDDPLADRRASTAYWDNYIACWHQLGYDYVRLEADLLLPIHTTDAPDVTAGSQQIRHWRNRHLGMIASWDDFERYPWPRVEEHDFFPFEYINSHLPDGMGLMVSHATGVFESLTDTFSTEGLCYALYDQPDLVHAVCQRMGQLMEQYNEHLLDLDRVVALFPGDDLGFRTGTLIAPDQLRLYVLPWHKRFAAQAHAHGVPYFLHSCGNVEAIMPDLIEGGIDAKHSFEDAIMPVTEFHARYADRIASLGGIDVDVLTRGTSDDVRARVRATIEACAPRGRYAIGSGNSIPSYVPVENYLAMLDEAQIS